MNARIAFWKLLLSRCWRSAPGTSALLTALIAAESVAVAVLAMSVRALVEGTGQRSAAHVLAAAAGAAGCLLIVNAGINTRHALRGNLSEQIGMDLEREIIGAVAGLPHLDHLERPVYLDRVALTLGSGPTLVAAAWLPLESIGSLASLVGSVFLLAQVDPVLLVLILFTPVPLLVNRHTQKAIRASMLATAESTRLEEDLFGLLTSPGSAKEIMICGAAPRLLSLRADQWRTATEIRQRVRRRAAVLTSAGWLVFTAAYAGCLAYTAHLAASGACSAGDLLLAITLAGQLRRQVELTVEGVSNVVNGAEALEPCLWLLRYSAEHAPAPASAHLRPPDLLRKGITLDEVTFRYPESTRAAVDSVSAHLPAGATVAVVGEYGSGKSSLVKLLCGLYPPERGRITVDGTDLRDFAPSSWSERLSVAFQDFGRYQTTLREAVGIGDLGRSSDPDALHRALADGDALVVADGLPDGLDSPLGRELGGVDLSEGQWQRVALARAAMRTAPLLVILDEPTAALDAPTEQAVFRRHLAMSRRFAEACGTVTLIVSHRLSTVREADLILVMEAGAVIEAGDHTALLARGGRYAELLTIHDALHGITTS
ncbi:ABC transporter ATP-binding protein [Kitasatospora azatica]|uniref:ABC transporter ATP-binding protein n=1 Tax=Kitasatospora azatica TaxID=58347 RepID=UPI0005625D61|nr:ABC transporter ATP-binding protein [Kitasatospora azatica]